MQRLKANQPQGGDEGNGQSGGTGSSGGSQTPAAPPVNASGSVQQSAATSNTIGGNTNEMNLRDSQNNNSGVITNDFSDNRISFQEGSNTYNFGSAGGTGSGSGTPMSNLTMAQLAEGESIGDAMKSAVAASAVNTNLQKSADKGFNPAAFAIAGNKSDTAGKMDQMNDYIMSSPQNMFDMSTVEMQGALGDLYKQDGFFNLDFVNKDKK